MKVKELYEVCVDLQMDTLFAVKTREDGYVEPLKGTEILKLYPYREVEMFAAFSNRITIDGIHKEAMPNDCIIPFTIPERMHLATWVSQIGNYDNPYYKLAEKDICYVFTEYGAESIEDFENIMITHFILQCEDSNYCKVLADLTNDLRNEVIRYRRQFDRMGEE